MIKFEEIVPGIKTLKSPFGGLWSGIALLQGEENILIDSGASAEIIDACLVPALKAEGLSLQDIDCLLNTHCHGDHVGGHFRIKELCGAKVVTFRGSLDKMRDPLKYNKLIRKPFPEHSPPPSASLKGVEPDVLLDDGDLFAGRLRLIHTPGHDDDCVSWLDEKTNTLISGDSLQGNGTILQGIGFYQDLAAYRATLRKLIEMAPENIIAGHPYVPIGDHALGEKASAEYLQKCLQLTEDYDIFIAEITDKGEDDPLKISRELIRRVEGNEPEYFFLALFTVTEHLKAAKHEQ